MENSNSWIVFDGKIISANRPVVPAVSRGLMYGDGVFETLRIYEGKTFCLPEHLNRLNSGLEILGIPKSSSLEIEQLKALLNNLLQKNKLLDDDAIVRIQLWRDGKRGYQPDSEAKSHYSITASSCPKTYLHPELTTVKTRRIPSVSMTSNAKFTNGINYILAAREATKKGADDALMLTTDGFISETTIANIFWIKGDTFFTPSDDCDLIPGITRNILMAMIEKESNWKIKSGKYNLDDLRDAEAAFICNSVRQVLPVQRFEEKEFNVENTHLKELQNRFIDYRDTNLNPLKIQ